MDREVHTLYRLFLVALDRAGFREDAQALQDAWNAETCQALLDAFEEGAEMLGWTGSAERSSDNEKEKLQALRDWMMEKK